jgi:exopolyphosphatase / guanosine-5'-triphosphate,3'-diphosphate pyrophosphatase
MVVGTQEKSQVAAIDLGSNSFHMAIAQVEHGEIRILERIGEKVQLGAGLQPDGTLDDAAFERALECLGRFAQRLRSLENAHINVVGTNALRVAKNRRKFLRKAQETLGTPIQVISGREEARLIYLGVSHTLSDDAGSRLVIDIGGGSTEFIIGERFEAQELESLHMGCVSYRDTFFPDGNVTRANFDRAVMFASRELLNIKRRYTKKSWKSCVGSSGSIKAVFQALAKDDVLPEKITFKDLEEFKETLIKLENVEKLVDFGVKKDRLNIFPAGFAILYASFKQLGIAEMEYTSGALREGLLYDVVGRIEHEDVRDRTIAALQQRYSVDTEQSDHVRMLASQLYMQVADQWGILDSSWRSLLEWAADVHEVGLTIAHTQYQKHGAYLLKHSDLPGFSKLTQSHLSMVVRSHRRKFPIDAYDCFSKKEARNLRCVSIILRVAVLLAADRDRKDVEFVAKADKHALLLRFEGDWLGTNPLTEANLEVERASLKKIGFDLNFC